MEVAEGAVVFRRKWLPFLPKDSILLGNLTWLVLRAASPISFRALPEALARLNVAWPKLQNHFLSYSFSTSAYVSVIHGP